MMKPQSDTRKFTPELIEALIAALIVAIANILFPDKIDAGTNIVLGVISLSTIAISFTIRQTAMSQTREVSDQLEPYRLLNSIAWPDLREQGLAAMNECKQKLARLAEGVDVSISGQYTEQEDLMHAVLRIRRAQKSIRTTGNSLFDIADPKFLSPKLTDSFDASLFEKAENGVTVELIEIGRRSDLEKVNKDQFRALINYYQALVNKGIQLYIVWMDDLKPTTIIQSAFLICDDAEVQYFVVSQPTVRSIRQVTVSRNPQTVNEYLGFFLTWKRLAQPFAEVQEFQQYKQEAAVNPSNTKT